MTTLELRIQLKALIDKEQDESLLQYALRLLKRDDQEAMWKAKLGARADRAEEDFADGRVLSEEEVKAHFDARHDPRNMVG